MLWVFLCLLVSFLRLVIKLANILLGVCRFASRFLVYHHIIEEEAIAVGPAVVG